jgi:hypothetical protein
VDVVEVCQNKTFIQLHNTEKFMILDTKVYIIKGDKMQQYSSIRGFNYTGFDMKNIVTVPEWEFVLILNL